MALVKYIEKQYEAEDGQVYAFWGPIGTQLDPFNQKATVLIRGWKDVAARQAGKKPCPDIGVNLEISFSGLGVLAPSAPNVPIIAQLQNTILTAALLDPFFEGCSIVTVEV